MLTHYTQQQRKAFLTFNDSVSPIYTVFNLQLKTNREGLSVYSYFFQIYKRLATHQNKRR
jgi:hypothetical protein